MQYTTAADRYDNMTYRLCGTSGLKLPAVSLGLWHNFGSDAPHELKRSMCQTAFDMGITHFDIANTYGPPPGSAERAFGEILKQDFASHRDETLVSTKAGCPAWPGPYGKCGSRKSMISSVDRSLRHLGVDYIDIFYSHRPDPETPMEETMGALDHIVRSGKALYVGISMYSPQQSREAYEILKSLGTPLTLHQPSYNMIQRTIEHNGLKKDLADMGVGSIVFHPLAQGMLTNKYLGGIPKGSRATQGKTLAPTMLTEQAIHNFRMLNEIADARGQTLAQMAIAWVLRDDKTTSALIGASKPEQVIDCAKAITNCAFTSDEIAQIDEYADKEKILQ